MSARASRGLPVYTRVYSDAMTAEIEPRYRRRPAALLEVDRRIDALDLEPVVYKLMHPDPREDRLSLDQADRAVELYRCFLKLCALFPATPIVPTRVIDQVWHAHMLDTAKYRTDCQVVFGRFLDHFPYAGLRGEADRLAWLEDFARTRTLFRDFFGVEIGGEAAASVCRSHGDGTDCCVGCVTSAGDQTRPRPTRPGDAWPGRREAGVGHVG